MNNDKVIVDVLLWGTCIGRLKWDKDRRVSIFQFTDEYLSMPYDICPSTHRKGRAIASFYGRPGELYQGLPEFLADALPDKWGSELFDRWLTANHIPLMDATPLLKLSYIGKRAMGAFEFVPQYGEQIDEETALDMSSLASLASDVYHKRDSALISKQESLTMKKLIYLGISAGGMRPKAVVAYNPRTGEFRSGQVDLPEDFKHYIIKFKEDPQSPTTEIEMIYHEMAKDAGIKMSTCFLKKIDGLNHFMTERFDRKGGEKILTQTLAAIMPGASDYVKLCWLANTLDLPQEDRDQIFIRMVFNFAAGISDDHTKNISFMMDRAGIWRLSPAYDVMFTANVWENSSAHIHSMGVMEKRSNLTIQDFMDFAEDFVDKPMEKIERVLDSVAGFGRWCDNYCVDRDIREKIQKVLDMVRPK